MPKIKDTSEFSVTVVASKEGYKTVSTTETVKVNKANGSLILSSTSGTLTYPTSTSFTISGNTGTLSVSSNNTNIATASISGNTVTVKPGTTAGKATITVTPSDAKIEYSTNGTTYSTTMPTITNTSSFTVTVRASKAGYKTQSTTQTVKVNKAAGRLTLSATSGTINYPNSTTFTVSGNTGTLSVSSSNTSVATVSISGSTVTVKSVGAGSATITVKSAASTNYNEKTATYTVTVKNPTFTADSGVGYYADTDGDGTPDGIIFEDFSKADSGSWCYKGDYSINEVTDLKEYYISEIGYKGPFGTKDVLRAKSENGNNRFYVMALEDVDNNTYGYWDAQNKVNGVWIVPPKNEWAAFATKLGITKSNYTTYKLAANYWSSTREPDWTGSFGAWQIEFSEWTIDFLDKKNTYHVRLATTF
jgi:hypothetical protein